MGLPAKKDRKYTLEDYMRTPDDERYELVEGVLLMVPAPSVFHQRISARLVSLAWRYMTDNKLGEVFHAPCDIVFDNETVLQPDLLVISNERRDIVGTANIQGAPDLIAEIISPSSAYYDLVKKKKIYARSGVKEYWLLDPEEKTAEVNILGDGAYKLHQSLTASDTLECVTFPGLKVDLAEVFK